MYYIGQCELYIPVRCALYDTFLRCGSWLHHHFFHSLSAFFTKEVDMGDYALSQSYQNSRQL